MMIIGLNGSPRLNGNTATLLDKALEGAASQGATVERIDLYKLQYRGCISCFYCKRKDKEHGVCAIKDDLSPILEKLKAAYAIIFSSPIYFMNISAGMVACLERFLFSNYLYSQEHPSVMKRMIPTGFIYTMNVTDKQAAEFSLMQSLVFYQRVIERILGIKPKVHYAFNTYQFDDYSKYEASIFSEPEKAEYKKTHFPIDCQKAFEMGCDLATGKR
jgi:multimeric flavodoxin WrbA